MNRQHAIILWLRPDGGADEGRPAKYPTGHARSSANAMANGQPADAALLLRWVAELVEPQPAQPVAPKLADVAAPDAA